MEERPILRQYPTEWTKENTNLVKISWANIQRAIARARDNGLIPPELQQTSIPSTLSFTASEAEDSAPEASEASPERPMSEIQRNSQFDKGKGMATYPSREPGPPDLLAQGRQGNSSRNEGPYVRFGSFNDLTRNYSATRTALPSRPGAESTPSGEMVLAPDRVLEAMLIGENSSNSSRMVCQAEMRSPTEMEGTSEIAQLQEQVAQMI